MKITYLKICNYKSIEQLEITDIENALILVGKNNTGKTAVIDAILLAMGMRNCAEHEFLDAGKPISISVHIEYSESDIMLLHSRSVLCKVKDYERWLADFQSKIPSYQDGILSFTFIVTPNMATRYSDGFSKHNEYIPEVLPKIYHIDQNRNLEALQNDVFSFYDKESFQKLKDNQCTFDPARTCNRCFQCIGLINNCFTPTLRNLQKKSTVISMRTEVLHRKSATYSITTPTTFCMFPHKFITRIGIISSDHSIC